MSRQPEAIERDVQGERDVRAAKRRRVELLAPIAGASGAIDRLEALFEHDAVLDNGFPSTVRSQSPATRDARGDDPEIDGRLLAEHFVGTPAAAEIFRCWSPRAARRRPVRVFTGRNSRISLREQPHRHHRRLAKVDIDQAAVMFEADAIRHAAIARPPISISSTSFASTMSTPRPRSRSGSCAPP